MAVKRNLIPRPGEGKAFAYAYQAGRDSVAE
jgi:hypothetical protein